MKLSSIVRRCFLSFTLIFSTISSAEIQQLQQNLFVAGVPSDQFEFFASPSQNGRQRQANWCWAASVQMVLNYHGLYVAQEQVVQRIYGTQIDRPANPKQIVHALSGWAPDNRGRYSSIHANPYTYSGSQIVQDLANRWPLIVGLSNPNGGIGHAVVLTGVYYSVDNFNNPIFRRVVIRDPWPGSPSKQEMSWNEFQSRLMFMTHIYVKRL
ncbi:papain-like cysteine protease family protein [Thaumasiovibrio subtropicus]|uniref:papain-like cysteine protease family protein n=1 Tax=Thaumasiovibrio subtropicus TaxID=1891207 RepID=UPI00131A63AC|nr:papain-like cysteine protease family protein [Thaumasiovibrio subtropicus]